MNAARDALETRAMKTAVDDDWQRSRNAGITGVPTFVCDGRALVGAQPFEAIEQLVVAAGSTRH